MLPTLVQGTLAVATLPLYTFVLDPADYGVFALLTAFTAPFAGIASLGSGYLLTAGFLQSDHRQRQNLVSTSLHTGMIGVLLLSGLFALAWHWISAFFLKLPWPAVFLVLFSVAVAYPWQIAVNVLILEGRSRAYAFVLIAQAVAATIATLCGLYLFQIDQLSLFFGSAAGAFVLGVTSLVSMRTYLVPRINRRCIAELYRLGPSAAAGSLAETAQVIVERTALAASVGLAALGLYNHSQQYRQIAIAGVKAVANSALPITLAEARNPQTGFPTTGRIWRSMHIGITATGLLFALIGEELLRALTHDKFTPAYPLVALWMIYLLFKHSGRAQYGYLLSANEGRYLSHTAVASAITGMVALVLLVPLLGIWGAFTAVLMQELLYRIGVVIRARQRASFPFHDIWAFCGAMLIAVGLLTAVILPLAFSHKLALLALAAAGLAIAAVRAGFESASPNMWSGLWGVRKSA